MNALGIIFSYTDKDNLRELTKMRTLASLPIGGKYRIIDLVLSNYVNSGIYDVSIITRYNYHSLIDHLGSGKEWDLNRKRGGLRVLTPMASPGYTESGLYRGTVEALASNMHSIKRSLCEYVVLCGSNILCPLDFEKLISCHMERHSDITVAYARSGKCGQRVIPMGAACLQMDENERVYDISFNGDDVCQQLDTPWSMGVFVMKKSLMESLVADTMSYGKYDFYKDIIGRLAPNLNIQGYEYEKKLLEISSVTGYMKANLSLLDQEVRENILMSQPIYTKVKDSVPVLYANGCHVSNSIISDGCKIEGTVENCVLSRGVRIGKGSVVRNSIIMQNTEVMQNVSLNHVILDKDVIVRENRQLTGHETYPVVIEKLSIV